MTHSPQAEMGTVAHRRAVEHTHPGPAEYVRIAVILAVITLAEVALYYVDIPDAALVVTLFVLSGLKFFLVAMWFMHLRFDSPIFRRLFVSGIILAILVYMVVLLSFRVFTPIADTIAKVGG